MSTFDSTWIEPGLYNIVLPSTVTNLYVYCYGGGGCGGFSINPVKTGGGGGGGCSVYYNATYAGGSSLSFTVGDGGISMMDDSLPVDGGESNLIDNDGSVTLCLANGGKGVSKNVTTGGSGASTSGAVGNSAKYAGGAGADGGATWSGGGGGGGGSTASGGNASTYTHGTGGSTGGGIGGNGINNTTGAGDNGSMFGGGGGGSIDIYPSTDGYSGGYGSPGAVRIVYTTTTINNIVTNIITSFKFGGGAESHCIGDSYNGGYIFYIDGVNSCGDHGLIVSKSDIDVGGIGGDIFIWGCFGTLIGGTSTSIGTGYANTQLILKYCKSLVSAAYVTYTYTSPDGWRGWYLPSQDELIEVYNRCIDNTLPLDFRTLFYSKTRWSSSENNLYGAYRVDCSTGNYYSTDKRTKYNVMPIKSF